MKVTEVDQTYGQSINIELKPGMGWSLYMDDGPGGPCGQGMRTTCPHAVLQIWPNQEAMAEGLKKKPRNKDHKLMWGVVDEYGVGVFRIIEH